MQRLRILSTFSITQDTENAIEKLQKAEKELPRKGGGNLAPFGSSLYFFCGTNFFAAFEDFQKRGNAPEC